MSEKKHSGLYEKIDEEDRNLAGEPYISWDLSEASAKISNGLSTDILRTLQVRLQLSNSELADILMISPRTLDRRKHEEMLPPDESERSYRIVRLVDLARETFGSTEKAAIWFKEPNYSLGNQTPVELVKTEPGARLVERTLGQLRHGISV